VVVVSSATVVVVAPPVVVVVDAAVVVVVSPAVVVVVGAVVVVVGSVVVVTWAVVVVTCAVVVVTCAVVVVVGCMHGGLSSTVAVRTTPCGPGDGHEAVTVMVTGPTWVPGSVVVACFVEPARVWGGNVVPAATPVTDPLETLMDVTVMVRFEPLVVSELAIVHVTVCTPFGLQPTEPVTIGWWADAAVALRTSQPATTVRTPSSAAFDGANLICRTVV
jgi:hypothetical protein